MTIRQSRLAARTKYLMVATFAAFLAALGTLGTAPQKADAYWVCPTFAPQWRPALFICGHDRNRPTINYVEKDSDPRAYGVYRSTTFYGNSISGSYFYSTTGNYFLQAFHCNPGYPGARNLSSVNLVYVAYTHAGSC